VVGKFTFVEGYQGRFRQPTIRYRIQIHGESDPGHFERLIHSTERSLGLSPDQDFRATPEFLAVKISRWMTRLLEQNNHPVCQEPVIKGVGKNLFQITQPCHHCRATAEVLVSLLILMTGDKRGPDFHLRKINGVLEKTRLNGFNQFHFIKNAHEMNIPWEVLHGGIALLGWGANSRWLDSSFTDRTPSISAKMARNKHWASNLLRKAGLPVPPQVMVNSKDELRRQVAEIGFPVVVKPCDQDGGVGVKAHLVSMEQVDQAYDEVAAISKMVILEKHVGGNDYRLQVVDGELQGVLERQPGGVYGDGVTGVLELVKNQNAERKHAQDDRKYLHAIEIDEEAEDQLKSQGLSWTSIPDPGCFVRLRGACNVASGGVPVEILLEQVHPDNKFLAINAANVLRLDVAGIDLLVPDIGISWLESGAYICEVNAQPQMFTTMHGPMLRKLFGKSDGRVPVVLFLGENQRRQSIVDFAEALQNDGVVAGYRTSSGAWIGNYCVQQSSRSFYESVKILTVNRLVQCILMEVDSLDDIGSGWPVDKIDYIGIDAGHKSESGLDYGTINKVVASIAQMGTAPLIFSPALGGDKSQNLSFPSASVVVDYQRDVSEIYGMLLEKLTARL
jgi:cyanophycin synthetase